MGLSEKEESKLHQKILQWLQQRNASIKEEADDISRLTLLSLVLQHFLSSIYRHINLSFGGVNKENVRFGEKVFLFRFSSAILLYFSPFQATKIYTHVALPFPFSVAVIKAGSYPFM
mgnify:CR=1 FL=1